MKIKDSLNKIAPWGLAGFFIIYTILSWILVFRDPRAVIGIGNLYPPLKEFLFSTEKLMASYGINSIPTIVFGLTAVIAVICYFIALRTKISFRKTIIFALIFQAITFLSFPILSTDIFSYIFSERVSTVHGENIWQVKPATFPDDQFGVLADWKDTTSVYGGIHYALYYLPSLIGGEDLLTLVILYKLIPALFTLGSMFIFYKFFETRKNIPRETLLRFIFWSPLFVLEIFSSGHNDAMMIFFTVLSYYLLKKNLAIFSAIALALAVQIKLIPIVLFFFCLLSLLRSQKIQKAILYAVAFFSINWVIFSFMNVSVTSFLERVMYNGGVYWQSLPTILNNVYPPALPFVSGLFAILILVVAFWQWKKKADPMESYVKVLLAYLVFATSAYWNWYVLWIFAFLLFITDRKVFSATVMLSITSLLAYPIYWIILRINTPSPIWPFVTYLLIFAPVIIVYLFSLFYPKQCHRIRKWFGLDKLIADKASD